MTKPVNAAVRGDDEDHFTFYMRLPLVDNQLQATWPVQNAIYHHVRAGFAPDGISSVLFIVFNNTPQVNI